MNHTAVDLPCQPADIAAALCEVIASADAVVQTLRVSRALVLSGRLVSLGGLEQEVARLCARCLGLHPDDGRKLRVHLLALRAEIDSTQALAVAQREAPR